MVAITGSAYGYVGDNPLNGTDPTGMFGCGFLWLGNCPSPAEQFKNLVQSQEGKLTTSLAKLDLKLAAGVTGHEGLREIYDKGEQVKAVWDTAQSCLVNYDAATCADHLNGDIELLTTVGLLATPLGPLAPVIVGGIKKFRHLITDPFFQAGTAMQNAGQAAYVTPSCSGPSATFV